jgi:hypothetical protein
MYGGLHLCLMASLSTLFRSSLAFHTTGDTSLANTFDSPLLKRDGGSISARETTEDDEDEYDT